MIWDTQIMHRLFMLGSEGHTCQDSGQSTLDACAQRYLGAARSKVTLDADGDEVRSSWAKWENRPFEDIPPIYLTDFSKKILSIFGCWQHLSAATTTLLESAHVAWGFVDDAWLERMTKRYGPQTHDLQVMAAVALDAIERVGFGIDVERRDDIAAQLTKRLADLRQELRKYGYSDGETGCDKKLQELIQLATKAHPEIDIPRTSDGNFSTTDEQLDVLADASEFFAQFKDFRHIRDLQRLFVDHITSSRIHAHYDVLKVTGRTSSRNPNIQGIPKGNQRARVKYPQVFVPADDHVLYVADFKSIELGLSTSPKNSIQHRFQIGCCPQCRSGSTSIGRCADENHRPAKC